VRDVSTSTAYDCSHIPVIDESGHLRC
jgi:hypothetical protein